MIKIQVADDVSSELMTINIFRRPNQQLPPFRGPGEVVRCGRVRVRRRRSRPRVCPAPVVNVRAGAWSAPRPQSQVNRFQGTLQGVGYSGKATFTIFDPPPSLSTTPRHNEVRPCVAIQGRRSATSVTLVPGPFRRVHAAS